MTWLFEFSERVTPTLLQSPWLVVALLVGAVLVVVAVVVAVLWVWN